MMLLAKLLKLVAAINSSFKVFCSSVSVLGCDLVAVFVDTAAPTLSRRLPELVQGLSLHEREELKSLTNPGPAHHVILYVDICFVCLFVEVCCVVVS